MVYRTPYASDLERYWAYIDRSDDHNACWPWVRALNTGGYGHFHAGGKQFIATRWGWSNLIGEIPPGHKILHRCDNPPCMNPGHWFTGTTQDNSDDMVVKGRQARGGRSAARLHPESVPRGSGHGMARLSEEGVREMRRMRMSGMTFRKIASTFDVDVKTAHRAIVGKTWAHVA